jgi:hypothetical protein
MSTGTAIAPARTIKPVNATATKKPMGVAITREPDGRYQIAGDLAGIEITLNELRGLSGRGHDPDPDPEPETRGRKPISAATKAKMAIAQKKRQAELRKAQQQGEASETAAPVSKRKPRTMTAGGGS